MYENVSEIEKTDDREGHMTFLIRNFIMTVKLDPKVIIKPSRSLIKYDIIKIITFNLG